LRIELNVTPGLTITQPVWVWFECGICQSLFKLSFTYKYAGEEHRQGFRGGSTTHLMG